MQSQKMVRGFVSAWFLALLCQPGLLLRGAPEDKIDPQILTQTLGGKQADFWLLLDEQADLGLATEIEDWAERGRYVVDTLKDVATRSQRGAVDMLRRRGVEHQAFWIANTIRVRGGRQIAEDLAARQEVAKLIPEETIVLPEPEPASPQARVNGFEWNISMIRANEVWDTFGTGAGIVVANIDTGVAFDHEALVSQYRGNIGGGSFDHNYNWHDPSNVCGFPSLVPCDNHGHGTHTMGTMVGGDGSGPFASDVGVAPGARWIAAKGCESGSCSGFALLSSAQWILAPTDLDGNNPRPDLRPHVVNNSWGGGQGDFWYLASVQAWRASGIFPAFANGNWGAGCWTTSSPGDYAESFGVGATTSSDTIAGFSSRGPSYATGGGIKPDASAPGEGILSSLPWGYDWWSGTSMATPHVAGTVALIWSAAPSLIGDIDATFAILKTTAVDKDDTSCGGTPENNNVYGEGRIDALAAVVAAPKVSGTLEGIVTDAGSGLPVENVLVTAVRQADGFTWHVTTGPAGTYTVKLPIILDEPGSSELYDLTASTFGYETGSVGSVLIVRDATTVQDFALTSLPRHDISGTVLDEVGNPVEGASVAILATPIPPATTDAAGNYLLADVPEGEYDVEASAGRCNVPETKHIVLVGDTSLDFALPARFDAFGYRCRLIPFDWVEATNDLGICCDSIAAVDLPFSFAFYGQEYSTAYVSAFGFLNFLGYYYRDYNDLLPDPNLPNGAIYPFWDYNYIATWYGDSIRVETIGAEPDRVWVVQYLIRSRWDYFGGQLSFQVQLHERSGAIDFLYQSMPSYGDGRSATVGIENHDGTIGFQYSLNEAALTDGLAIRFEPPPSGTLEGRVTDAVDGAGIAGATVKAFKADEPTPFGNFIKHGVVGTDVGGGSDSSYDAGSGVYTSVSTTAGDIWDCGDSFEFAYTRFAGDFDVSIAFTDRQHSTGLGRWGKFGLMARRSLAVDSRFTMVQDHLPFLDDPARVSTRTKHEDGCGGMYDVLRPDSLSFHPQSMRLTRRGNVVQGWYSDLDFLGDPDLNPCDDGSWMLTYEDDWGDTAVPDLYVGFANSEHNSDGVATQTVKFKTLCWNGTDTSLPPLLARETATGDDGSYRMKQLGLGTYQVEASATSYETAQAGLAILEDETTVQDFALRAARARLEPADPIDVISAEGVIKTRSLELSNIGILDLTFEIREQRSTVTVGSPAPMPRRTATATATATASSRTPPQSYTLAEPQEIQSGGPVLVFMDSYPWGSDALLQVLNSNGIAWNLVGSWAMGSWDLSPYEVVYISSDQPWWFYAEYNTYASRFADYVENGGYLWISGAAWGWNGGDFNGGQLPGGVTVVGYLGESSNDVLAPDHPVMAGVPNPFFGSGASHAAFTNLPADAIEIARGPGSGLPTLVEYEYGFGKVLALGQTLEFGWNNGQDAGIILANSVPHAYEFEPVIDIPWLSVAPTDGVLAPGASQELTVTIDSTGLAPGVYEAGLRFTTNDPRNPRKVVPVKLIVSAYQRLVNCGGSSYVDASQDTWLADQKYAKLSADPWGYTNNLSISRSTTSPIYGTTDDPLYQDQRIDPWEYRFDGLPPAMYEVRLMFAEYLHTKILKRLFDVTIEGELEPSLYALDIFYEAGRYSADDHICIVPVTDGQLNIRIVHRGFFDFPFLNAIGVTERPDIAMGEATECSMTSFKDPSAPVIDEAYFRRGDANADGEVDMSDPIAILGYLFLGGQEPPCAKSADANDSGDVDIADGIYTLGYLFLGGTAPNDPSAACGPDPTPDPVSCDAYAPCQ